MNETDRGPFALTDRDAYRRWRDNKLQGYPGSVQALIVEIGDPLALTAAEIDRMTRLCQKTNMVIYACRSQTESGKNLPRKIGKAFGLTQLDKNLLADDDGITSLQVMPGKSRRGYIPYSDHRLLWHTDGYYNVPQRRIRAFSMHCVQSAAEGGENALLDHEILYILMREADPEYIRALMAPDAMTIPANTESEEAARPASVGPVFFVDSVTNRLAMRYTARTRSIIWKSTAETRAAVGYLEGILAAESPYRFRYRPEAGQGLLCNNILHNRTAFTDDSVNGKTRLIYRARYHDRIAGT